MAFLLNQMEFLFALLLFALASIGSGQSTSDCKVTRHNQPRLFLLTDIANEPDDAQSLVGSWYTPMSSGSKGL
jgi:hypothetical protein